MRVDVSSKVMTSVEMVSKLVRVVVPVVEELGGVIVMMTVLVAL